MARKMGHMFKRPVTLAIGSAALMLATVTLTATGAIAAPSGTQRVRVISSCNKATYQPKNYVFFCADAGAGLDHGAYDWWTQKTAHGTGVYYFNDCKPNCAAGQPHREAAQFTLYRVRTTTKYGPLFTRIELDTRHRHLVYDLPTSIYA